MNKVWDTADALTTQDVVVDMDAPGIGETGNAILGGGVEMKTEEIITTTEDEHE